MSMSLSHPFPAATLRFGSPRAVTAASLPTQLLGGGAGFGIVTIILFVALSYAGLLTADVMVLLALTACVSGAAGFLGLMLACIRDLRHA